MPLYEFECPHCQAAFEELVRNSEAIKDVACPSCGGQGAKKKLSTVAARTGSASAGYASAPSCAPGGT